MKHFIMNVKMYSTITCKLVIKCAVIPWWENTRAVSVVAGFKMSFQSLRVCLMQYFHLIPVSGEPSWELYSFSEHLPGFVQITVLLMLVNKVLIIFSKCLLVIHYIICLCSQNWPLGA